MIAKDLFLKVLLVVNTLVSQKQQCQLDLHQIDINNDFLQPNLMKSTLELDQLKSTLELDQLKFTLEVDQLKSTLKMDLATLKRGEDQTDTENEYSICESYFIPKKILNFVVSIWCTRFATTIFFS